MKKICLSVLRTALILFWLCLSGAMQAQEMRIQRFGAAQGLPSDRILSMLQDREGFIWLGTTDGLYRFDGYTFKRYAYNPDDPHSMPSNSVESLYEDREGYIWAGLVSALVRLDKKTEQFSAYIYRPDDTTSLGPGSVLGLYEDPRGRFWVSAMNGRLQQMDRKTGVFYNHFPQPEAHFREKTQICSGIFPDPNQEDGLWFGCLTEGKWRMFSFDTGTKSFSPLPSDGLPPYTYLWNILYDGDIAWFATSGGLIPFNTRTRTFSGFEYLPEVFEQLRRTPVVNGMMDASGRLWIGTQHEGLYVLDKKLGQLAHYRHDPADPASLSGNRISSLLNDRSGTYWMGTSGYGLNRMTPTEQQFEQFILSPGLTSNAATSFLELEPGDIWVSANNTGLYVFSAETRRLEPAGRYYPALDALKTVGIYDIGLGPDGRLWIGANGHGLYGFDRRSGALTNYRHNPTDTSGLLSNYVHAVLTDRKGRLWLGNFYGLDLLDPETGLFLHHYAYDRSDLANHFKNKVNALYEDQDGNLWVGLTSGLARFDPATKKFHFVLQATKQHANGLLRIHAVYRDRAGILWAGSPDGLYRIIFPDPANPQKGTPDIMRYTEEHGLAHQTVFSIAQDSLNRLWINTAKGLSLFRNSAHNNSTPPNFKNFGMAHGQQNGPEEQAAIFPSKTGCFLISGRLGFDLAYLNRIQDNAYAPPIRITALEKLDTDQPDAGAIPEKGISVREEVNLSYKNNIFSLEFAALDFRDPSGIQYAYRMLGLNDSWIQIGAQRKVTFTNLPPGTYTFEVRGTNSDGIWNDTPASLRIVIQPPWWQTWWAYALYGLLVLGALGLFVRMRLRFLRQQTRQLEKAVHIGTEKIRSQKEQLEQQARELQELDRLKSRFYTNITHELRTPLTLILGPLESLIKNNRLDGKEAELLKMARQNGQKLGKMIQSILDLSKLEAGKLELRETPVAIAPLLRQMASQFDSFAVYLGIQLRFQTDLPDNLSVMLDAPKMETILNNLISNALKFTEKGGRVDVGLSASETTLLLTVKDTGRGIHPEDLPHVFDRFYQTRRREIPAEGGTGIGLALSAELVKLQGGRIWAESEPGRGSAFFFEWPKRLPPPGTPETSPRSASPPAAAFGAPEPVVESRTDAPKILIVEDNPDLQTYLTQLLAPLYDLTLANNGEEALEAVEGADLIISDVLMPRMDGFQLLDRLKADDRYRGIPVIMLTARADIQDKLRALRTGVDDYLTKPFDEEELLARVRNLLARKSNRQETDATETATNRISEADSEWLAALEAWTKANLQNEHLSVATMARQFALSERQLLRRMRELTGLSPQQYIGELRLQKAREALERGAYRTVAEAAYAAGFRNAKAFARAFKERFGRLPSSYF